MKDSEAGQCRSLREVEAEVDAEMRASGRQRLQEKLQAQADRHGRIFPLSARPMWHRRQQPLLLRTAVGDISLQVWYCFDSAGQSWGCPMRQRWGLAPHQHTSTALEDKVLFTGTATGTYEQSAAVVTKWGYVINDSTVHGLVQSVGARAEAQIQTRLKTVPGNRPGTRAQRPGRGDDRWLDGALSRAGLGSGKNRGNPRGLARIEDWRLFTDTSKPA